MDIPKLKQELEEGKKIKEQVKSEMSQADLSDTQNEFFTVDMEMRDMIRKMTLKQRQKMNTMVKKFADGL